MFNALGYSNTHSMDALSNINNLIELFDRRSQLKDKSNVPFLLFKMSMNNKTNYIEIDLNELNIEVDIKMLLILSNLANTDAEYIKGPAPVV